MKNLDGISKIGSVKKLHNSRTSKPRILRVDGLTRRPVLRVPRFKAVVVIAQPKAYVFSWQGVKRQIYSQKKVSIAAAALALVLAFGAGSWAAINTSKSAAESQPGALADSTIVPQDKNQNPNASPLAGSQLQEKADSSVSQEVLFNTPIEYLQQFLANVSQPDIIAKRKESLAQFLKDRHSPLASAAETISEQDHWQLILAIAFAESSLGKNCTDNNCSNIGVGPGNSYWRKYVSYNAWAIDFNRLLEKKYKDWTLEQMCGVYVKPCNTNWLLSTKTILADLKDRGIE